jgi:Protein of unknown function (DUF2971)
MAYVSPWRTEHESFPQPDDATVKVWRYLNLAGLAWILSRQQLPFLRVDLFADPFEGSVTRTTFDAWSVNPRNAKLFAQIRPQMKRQTYASCWHLGSAESEAMWRLYCSSGEGVALQTSYETLDAALDPGVFLGKVSYVDYEKDSMPSSENSITPFMHKRPAFAFEQEVRAVIWKPAYEVAKGLIPDLNDQPDAMPVSFDVDKTIEALFVSPYAPEWYRDAVLAVVDAMCAPLASRVEWSGMKRIPLY